MRPTANRIDDWKNKIRKAGAMLVMPDKKALTRLTPEVRDRRSG